jgi:hypothetical protein
MDINRASAAQDADILRYTNLTKIVLLSRDIRLCLSELRKKPQVSLDRHTSEAFVA